MGKRVAIVTTAAAPDRKVLPPLIHYYKWLIVLVIMTIITRAAKAYCKVVKDTCLELVKRSYIVGQEKAKMYIVIWRVHGA